METNAPERKSRKYSSGPEERKNSTAAAELAARRNGVSESTLPIAESEKYVCCFSGDR